MKKTKQLATIQSKLEQLRDELIELLEEREEYADARSEKWSDSEAGEKYTDDTSNLESVKDSVESAVDDLESLFEND